MQKILFVCTGNTCRSPMAEAITNYYVKDRQLDIQAYSRGINVLIPQNISENAKRVIKSLYNINIENHISKQISKQDIQKADLILTMTKNHEEYIKMAFGENDKIYSIYRYLDNNNKDVKDPYGGTINEYEDCAKEIDFLIDKILSK